MKTVPLKCVTLIAEETLRQPLIDVILELGAKGYTLTRSEGEGSRHLRAGEIPGQNVRIETIVSDAVADAIIERVAQEFFENYAIIVTLSEVHVVRGEKYV